MKTDVEIAQEANLKPISEMANYLGIPISEVEQYGLPLLYQMLNKVKLR